MLATRRIRGWLCGVVALASVTLAPSAAQALVPGPAWVEPTPADGARFRVVAGKALRIALVARTHATPSSTITIAAAGIPAGATFRTTPGNPAASAVSWTPKPSQAGGRFAIIFTAQSDDSTVPPATRKLLVEVVRAKARAFTLSSGDTAIYRWAFVIRRAVARAAPDPAAEPVVRLQRLTPEATTNLVLALEGRRTRHGVWIRVRLPILPNNTTGWVPRKALGNWRTVRTHLLVDRRALTLALYRSGRAVFRARVGVGAPGTPTPAGEFYVRNLLYGFNDPFYGPFAFGTSARSPVLTDWPGGGFIGIHGTNQPGVLPGRVSHGCIRLRNGDMVRLAAILPVGTPLTIR
jgi:hypothetical protein